MQTLKKYFEFSKLISYAMTALVFWISYKVIGFAEVAIQTGYTGTLPFLTTMITAVWGAYATVMSFMFNKSKAENIKKIERSYMNKSDEVIYETSDELKNAQKGVMYDSDR